ncbi:hypothetical protein GCM10028771_37070 [Nocardioides marmoraquaticus]
MAFLPDPAAVPSPQLHEYDATDPSESADPDPSTATPKPLGLAVNDAVGATLLAETVTVRVVLAVAPSLSVTVSVIVFDPAVA